VRNLVSAISMAAIGMIGAGAAGHAQEVGPAPELDRLIEQFNATAPRTEGRVDLDAWIESNAQGTELVVVLDPKGDFKLVADPGITITPTAQPGVEWLVPLPYRQVAPEIQYFTAPATVRVPFRASGEPPLEVLVEYAYCVVDYQCFFGEQLLTVAARYD
jgi:hypothetical protein